MKKYSIRNFINVLPNLAHFPTPGAKAKIERKLKTLTIISPNG